MSRNAGNKKRGAQPRGSSGGGGKRWPFFVGGLLLGLLLAGGVYLLKILPTAMELRERAKQEAAACAEDGKERKSAAARDAGQEKPAGEPVKFQFYTMLPQQEVVAPVAGDKTTVATPPPLPAADKPADKPAAKPAADAARYLLQAGSFRTRQEADRRRAELVLSGLNVSVQDVKAGNDNWFRVMVGPFGSEPDMQKARQQLASMKVDTLPIRLK